MSNEDSADVHGWSGYRDSSARVALVVAERNTKS
jgi:hypothetical protein